jgi:hypothetical protein
VLIVADFEQGAVAATDNGLETEMSTGEELDIDYVCKVSIIFYNCKHL